MSKIKQAMETKAELAMMGKFVPVDSEDEVRFITSYIIGAIAQPEGKKPRPFDEDFDIYTVLHRYNELNTVTHVGCNTVYGMPCITYCIDPMDGETPYPFTEDYGTGSPCAFCYCFNLGAHDTCSEFGDCFFDMCPDGYYHRAS